MNPVALQKLVAEAITDNVYLNWRFYVALVSIGVLTAVVTSMLEGWGEKKGEVAATKSDFEEIKRQLKETTETTKSMELSLAHGDWLRKEQNTLKRVKLEELLTAAFGLSSWAVSSSRIKQYGLDSNEVEVEPGPIDQFDMLAVLYFPELENFTGPLGMTYRKLKLTITDLRYSLWEIDVDWSEAESKGDTPQLDKLLIKRQKLLDEYFSPITEQKGELYNQVLDLGYASRGLMQNLISELK